MADADVTGQGTRAAAVDPSPLDRARRKAYRRLLPLCFISYVIAYVDRSNVAIAKLTMARDLPGFDNAVIGLGAGIFFIGYFLLEIPGTLIVEKWSARKWIARIMITWGITAALTAAVKTPFQFYVLRFLLGLAEERAALLAELEREKGRGAGARHVKLSQALRHPKVLLLAIVYFLVVTGSYGVEFFMPSILERWYALKFDALTWLVILPPLLALAGQLFVGWSSDRTKERRLHTAVPMAFGAAGLLLVIV